MTDPKPTADLYVAGLGSWLPRAVPVAEAVRAGSCDDGIAALSGMASVTIDSSGDVPAEMAVRAARIALDRSGVPPAELCLLLHAHLYDQGNELWSPAAYIQRRTGAGHCPAVSVQQVSNGSMAAIDLATAYLRARPGGGRALVTTADRFALPGFDRWRSDPGTVYADGGTALVLSTESGFARLTALATVSDSELEGMHRMGPASGVGHATGERPVDLGANKHSFVAQFGAARALAQIVRGQQRAMEAALAQAHLDLGRIDRFVLPHFGQRRLRSNYLRYLDIDLDRTNWQFSRTVGHLGAGDQVASIDHLLQTAALTPGQRCMVLTVGAGFTWSCAVLEIDRPPPLTPTGPVSPPPKEHAP